MSEKIEYDPNKTIVIRQGGNSNKSGLEIDFYDNNNKNYIISLENPDKNHVSY